MTSHFIIVVLSSNRVRGTFYHTESPLISRKQRHDRFFVRVDCSWDNHAGFFEPHQAWLHCNRRRGKTRERLLPSLRKLQIDVRTEYSSCTTRYRAYSGRRKRVCDLNEQHLNKSKCDQRKHGIFRERESRAC